MPEAGSVEIEVACAGPDEQIIRTLRVRSGTTARQALSQAGLERELTGMGIAIETATLGVFGRVVPGTYVPGEGDRIEVYRPLRRDPGAARRKRCQTPPSS